MLVSDSFCVFPLSSVPPLLPPAAASPGTDSGSDWLRQTKMVAAATVRGCLTSFTGVSPELRGGFYLC